MPLGPQAQLGRCSWDEVSTGNQTCIWKAQAQWIRNQQSEGTHRAGTCDQTQAPGRCPQTQMGKLRPITLSPHFSVRGSKERKTRRKGLCQLLLRDLRRLERKVEKGCGGGERLLQLLQASIPFVLSE